MEYRKKFRKGFKLKVQYLVAGVSLNGDLAFMEG
jgi:hypothetical protein